MHEVPESFHPSRFLRVSWVVGFGLWRDGGAARGRLHQMSVLPIGRNIGVWVHVYVNVCACRLVMFDVSAAFMFFARERVCAECRVNAGGCGVRVLRGDPFALVCLL